jgi:hypothetical protein
MDEMHVPDSAVIKGDIYPSVAVGPQGEAWAAWMRYDVGYETDLYASRLLLDIIELRVEAQGSRVEIFWRVAGTAPREDYRYEIWRSNSLGEIERVARINGSGDTHLVMDEILFPGVSYSYWIDIHPRDTVGRLFSTNRRTIQVPTVGVGEDAGGLAGMRPFLGLAPNPAGGAAMFHLTGPPGEYQLQIFDLLGRLLGSASGPPIRVLQDGIPVTGALDSVVSGRLPAGVYWARARPVRGGPAAVAKLVVAP